MNLIELCYVSAIELSNMMRRREVSPVEIMEAVLTRIEALNPRLNAYLTVDGEAALTAARAAETAMMRNEDAGILQALPVSIKDIEPTNGLRCTYGSRFYADNIANIDGVVSQRVKAAGGIILGKTNTPHFGHKDMCDNLLGPPGRNPWRLDRTPGGSSGGAAAAVAAGLGPLAHGSDGAGSIRIPAALCGVFGFKPSFGRVPYWPNPDIWTAVSHNGPLARTVGDAALLLSAIAGPDMRDPSTIDSSPDDYVNAVSQPLTALRGLRIAWSADFGYAAVDPEVRRLTQQAALRFQDFECVVEAVDPGWQDPRRIAETAWNVTFAARWGDLYDEQPEWFEPSFAEMIEAGRAVTGPEFVRTSMARTQFYRDALAFFQGYDLLLTPQMPVGAWPVEQSPHVVDGLDTPSMFDRLSFTFPFNMTGQPAASVPCGFTQDGLPVALQIVGGWHADTLVLKAASAFESAQPWAQRTPPLDE